MVTVTNVEVHDLGCRKGITADLADVANAETWTVAHLSKIFGVGVTCTTDDTTSCSWSGNVVTFADGATLAGSIFVYIVSTNIMR